MKYQTEVLETQKKNKGTSSPFIISTNNQGFKDKAVDTNKFLWHRTKIILRKNVKIIIGLPLSMSLIAIIYVFFIANPVYTSISKVLPISEDRSNSSGFSGMAAQFGINIPLSIGGTVPWDEIYPEIVKSSDLLTTILAEKYATNKYGEKSLKEIIINEYSLLKYKEDDQHNRAMIELRKMIRIIKDRLSPVVTLEVSAFEPLFL